MLTDESSKGWRDRVSWMRSSTSWPRRLASPARPLAAHAPQLPRPRPVLEGPAPARALEVVPLFGVLRAHPADMAADVPQRLGALRAQQRRRRDRRRRRIVMGVRAARHRAPRARSI